MKGPSLVGVNKTDQFGEPAKEFRALRISLFAGCIVLAGSVAFGGGVAADGPVALVQSDAVDGPAALHGAAESRAAFENRPLCDGGGWPVLQRRWRCVLVVHVVASKRTRNARKVS